MTIEQKIIALEARRNTLEAKGPQNNALVKKANRQIRKYKKMLENSNN